jgi:transcriptional regulator with XRE-family HTH domain
MTANYTQKELAYLLGLPATTISRWENGSRIPGVKYAVGLSVATNRLVDEIFRDFRNEWVEKINQRVKTLDKGRKNSTITINDDKK